MKTSKITACALFLSVSFVISLLEGAVPLPLIPGLKLGFANIAVVAAFFYMGKNWALSIVITRPLLALLLFGNLTSFLLSLSGGLLAWLSLCFTLRLYTKALSFCGISAISAVCHSIGQILAASLVVADYAVYAYLPLLCAASSVAGFFTGCIMNAIIPRIINLSERSS